MKKKIALTLMAIILGASIKHFTFSQQVNVKEQLDTKNYKEISNLPNNTLFEDIEDENKIALANMEAQTTAYTKIKLKEAEYQDEISEDEYLDYIKKEIAEDGGTLDGIWEVSRGTTNEYINLLNKYGPDENSNRISEENIKRDEEYQRLSQKYLEEKLREKQNREQQEINIKMLGNARLKLMEGYRKYLGMPYKLGGNGTTNIDCSLFVQKVYRELGINIPRTTYYQVNVGKRVSKLKPGDLIFFDTLSYTSSIHDHVGMYIGNNKMVHASTHGGVHEESLLDYYYKDRISAMVSIIDN